MAGYNQVPNPEQGMRDAAPAVGLPAPNQGGISPTANAPQRPNFRSPIVRAPAGPPGPAPGLDPLHGALPITRMAAGMLGQPPPQTAPAPVAPPTSEVQPPSPGSPAAAGAVQAPQPQAQAQPQPVQQPVNEAMPTLDDTPDLPETPWLQRGAFGYVPNAFELDGIQPGEAFDTPVGQIHRDYDGQLHVTLSAEAQAALEGWRARELVSYGRYPGHDNPHAPAPDLLPGMPWFNPHTGQWGGV